jgi:hypothetical protein
MLGGHPALPAMFDGLNRQIFQGAQSRIPRIIHEHRDILVVSLRQIEHLVDMGAHVLFGEFDPGNPAHHVGAQIHGLPHPIGGAGISNYAVLREGDDLNLDPIPVLLSGHEERLDAFQPALGIHVGEGANVCVAVLNRQVRGPSDILDNPRFIVVLFHPGGLLDGGHGAAHTRAVVAPQAS